MPRWPRHPPGSAASVPQGDRCCREGFRLRPPRLPGPQPGGRLLSPSGAGAAYLGDRFRPPGGPRRQRGIPALSPRGTDSAERVSDAVPQRDRRCSPEGRERPPRGTEATRLGYGRCPPGGRRRRDWGTDAVPQGDDGCGRRVSGRHHSGLAMIAQGLGTMAHESRHGSPGGRTAEPGPSVGVKVRRASGAPKGSDHAGSRPRFFEAVQRAPSLRFLHRWRPEYPPAESTRRVHCATLQLDFRLACVRRGPLARLGPGSPEFAQCRPSRGLSRHIRPVLYAKMQQTKGGFLYADHPEHRRRSFC
jgi:hypothetical protein